MRFFRLAALLTEFIFAPLRGAAWSAESLRISVYHTNDIHGWIMERPHPDGSKRRAGGAPALAALLSKDAGPKLLVDAGDWWQGTPEGTLTKGESVAEMFNLLEYDAVAVGNHEYDAGQDNLKALIPKIKAPVLSVNTYDSRSGKRVDWLKPWVIKEVAGIRFGIFGLTLVHMKQRSLPKHIAGLEFRREVVEAKKAVAALKKEGADVIIALTHVGFEEPTKPPFEGDQTIAKKVPGIDLIVGGHTHTFLKTAYRDEKNGTLVVQAGHFLLAAGKTTLVIDKDSRKVTSSSAELIDLDPTQGEHAEVKAFVDRRAAELGEAYTAVLATAPSTLVREAERESTLGDWMADCYRERNMTDVALQNGGGIRADLPSGPLTMREFFHVMPYDNTLVVVTITGKVLRELLDHGLGAPRIVSISGAAVRGRRHAASGKRILDAAAAGSPLDDKRRYTVAASNFITDGGDGYAGFSKATTRVDTGELVRDALRACAQRQSLILPPATGRLTLRE